jgi:hypothetical protein
MLIEAETEEVCGEPRERRTRKNPTTSTARGGRTNPDRQPPLVETAVGVEGGTDDNACSAWW